VLVPDNTEGPEFAIAMRGYDRAQVDDYLARLHEWLLESQARTARAEEEAAAATGAAEDLRQQLVVLEERSFSSTPDSIKALGDRVGRILTTAFEAAEDMRTTAEHDSASLVADAKARAAQVLDDAQVEADGLLEGASRQREAVEQQVAGLAEHRARAEEELGRLHQYLAGALRSSAPDGASEPGSPADERTQLIDLTSGPAPPTEPRSTESSPVDGPVASSA
jgi:cell division septum initiation protein DivIVA